MDNAQSENDLYNAPIATRDAAMMLKRNVRKNERPYYSQMLRLNNERVENWKKNILDEVADSSGTVAASRVWPCWKVYDEGLSTLEMVKLNEKGMIHKVDDEVIDFWKNFFENFEPSEMYPYGSGNISAGWTIITNHIKLWCTNEKYDALYGKFKNPVTWEKKRPEYSKLLEGELLPFWFQERISEIREKVTSVLINQIEAQGLTNENAKDMVTVDQAVNMLKRKTKRNDRPYISETTYLNNEKVGRWRREVLDKLPSLNGRISRGEALQSFQRYDEGLSVLECIKLRDEGLLPEPSPEIIEMWKELFENSEIEDLHPLGSGTVGYGWNIITTHMKMWNVLRRHEELFGKYTSPIEWEMHYLDCKDLFEKNVLPFWDEETFSDISDKVMTVLTNVVEPQGMTGWKH